MPTTRLPLWPILLLVTLVGLALRIAAARGGLWLDEAWSAAFARDVATPAGVMLSINHDNNHHLNTLWLQVVGFAADPMLQRALSIASGTLTIVVAGLIAARRSVQAAAVTAILFAVSPILVTYGSEARGYAPMLLALVASVALVDRWLDARQKPAPALGLAILAVLGMLAQLTMAFGQLAIAGWVFLRVLRESGLGTAIVAMLRAQVLPLASAAAVVAGIFGIALDRGGFHFGALQPFDPGLFGFVLSETVAWILGLPVNPALAPAVFVATLLALAFGRSILPRAPLYAIAIAGLPLAMAALQMPNSGIGRYYLLSAAALLLLAGEIAGLAFRKGGAWRLAAWATLGIIVAGSLWRDAAIIANLRADPAQAIAAMAKRSPAGTVASVDRARAEPVLESAAASRGYPLAFVPCGQYLFVDRDGTEPFPLTPVRCGYAYRLVAGNKPAGLSGTHWRLYERVGTP